MTDLDLNAAYFRGDGALFDAHTGDNLTVHGSPSKGAVARSRGAQAGLEPPRFCPLCGRRMIVQVHPMGWRAECSRHGSLDSADQPDGPSYLLRVQVQNR